MLGRISRVLLISLLFALLLGAAEVNAQPQPVWVLTLNGSVNPISARYLVGRIEGAQDQAGLIVIEMNTPGGTDTSMREIIQSILLSKVPVAVFVYPQGSRAASAGTFITCAAPIAAMAPGTSIGAAHPVLVGGSQPDPVMEAKLTNDAASYIVSLAQRNGRNSVEAEKTVRESASYSAEEALQKGLVDYLAPDLSSLLAQLDGRVVNLNGQTVTLATQGAPLSTQPESWWDRFLEAIADPNLAYMFLLLGIFALIAEVFHPTVVAGVIGAISLILALLAMETLPVNLVGLLLLIVAAVLFILEVKTPGFGILGAGGIFSFVLGSLLLFNPQYFPLNLGQGVSLWLIGGFTVFSFIFFFGVIAAAIKVRNRPRMKLGMDAMPGSSGVASSGMNPAGTVLVAGSYWRARSIAGVIQAGESVRVVGKEGLELLVEKDSTGLKKEEQA